MDIGGNEHWSYAPLNTNPKFYTYYGDYDWVVFCWLFGRMINLPQGFPMYSIDLKQIIDNMAAAEADVSGTNFDTELLRIKIDSKYPKQNNEHNALYDARWNKELYNFIRRSVKPTGL